MCTEAPYEYIRGYYDHVHRVNAKSPEVASFWLSSLEHVRGECVLNVGCGPQLYDYLMYFGAVPKRYVGLDLNRNTFEFLRRSEDPRLLEAKSRADAHDVRVEYVCADVFDYGELQAERFESVLGVGFFATFHGARFERLIGLMHDVLEPGGTLLKITWHGPHRSAAETRNKLEYGYDNSEEPAPEVLVTGFKQAGFALEHQSILECDPGDVGWDAIQVCVFRKDG